MWRGSLVTAIRALARMRSPRGIHFTMLYLWMRTANVEDDKSGGTTAVESVEPREAKRRIKTLEQENEILRRAAAYFSRAHLPGK
jgi:transposase